MGGSEALAPCEWPPALTRCGHPSQCTRQFVTEAHSDGALVGLKLGWATSDIADGVRHDQPAEERPRHCGENHADSATERRERRRMAGERGGCRRRDVLQEEPESSQHEDRNCEPLGERQSHRVKPEVMTEFVSEYATQFIARQRVDGERGDHDEVSTAGEGIQLVCGEYHHDISLRRLTGGLEHRSPCGVEPDPLVTRGVSGTDQRCE